ncbi:hypothetical protein C8Q75DRAFT_778907 [Abortiporus biennis]|nr:hypothetical protein C8Q75DRAFT_778907 [Abortiporus biennis]
MASNLSTITRGMEFEEITLSIHRVTELSLHESSQRQDPVTIYCFPDELLAKIFHSVHDQVSWTWNWETITHVCQWWRIVALNDSTLWSEIEVYLDRRSFNMKRLMMTTRALRIARMKTLYETTQAGSPVLLSI